MRCIVFVWRRDGEVWQSERYGSDVTTMRRRMVSDLRGNGRVLYAKEHTGVKYGNGGRFV